MFTKSEAVAEFKREGLQAVAVMYEIDGNPDWPARREAWNSYTDALCKAGVITEHQCDTWTHPAICGR